MSESRVSSSWALEWVDLAIALEEENRALRGLITSLIFWISENEGLAALARAAAERKAA